MIQFSFERNRPRGSLYDKGVYPPEFNEKFRQSIRDRDKNHCSVRDCTATRRSEGQELDVHHIDYTKWTVERNCITLCRNCHKRVHRSRLERGMWYRYFHAIIVERERLVTR